MDLLLDVDLVLDLCTPRHPGFAAAANALERCQESGGKVWLYVGSVQTARYCLARTLQEAATGDEPLRNPAALALADRILHAFAADKHWLAALAGEGDLFTAADPENAQLIAALARFEPDGARLLTRNQALLAAHPALTVSPEAFCAAEPPVARVDFIDLKAQQGRVRAPLEEGLHRILHHGRYVLGPEVAELEQRLAVWVGAKHCIGLSSGTDALLVALMALGVGPGDEVITTPFTFVATAEVIVLIGAVPIFVDIEPASYNLDPALLEAKITPRTRAIMPVSLYGQCADMDAINAIAARHGLPVIEDAAQSLGATYKGRRSGALSTIGATSFFPSKPLGGYGDGGACFTDDDALARAMREIMNHGQDRRYNHPRLGINGRIDTLQAAVLLAKLAVFDDEIARRTALGAAYSERFTAQGARLAGSAATGLMVPAIAPHNTSVYAQYTLQVDDRDAVAQRLSDAGIPSAVHYPIPLNRQGAYAHLCCPDCTPNADHAAARVISLPMHPYLSDAQMTRVVAAVMG